MQQHMKVKELVAAAHAAAPELPPAAAQLMREVATRLDVTFVALSEAMGQRDALAAEGAARGEIIERLIGQYSAAGYHAVQNSLNPAQSLLYDAMQVLKQTATDAYLNSVRAEGVKMAADCLKLKNTVGSTGAMAYLLNTMALELRAGKDGE
ncbi:hypothetical protein [Pantoea agglomerans]|uniref:hypothetical protein n=1 Tax=Enterobacter agglomerans TaxID=549 RepID=UPI0013B5D5A5|nr:hypothetical protein [Pantoea agglomerans]NEG58224.1 hypothetical protein [Pantoea agglomerans]NEG99937.1 hypothetical protein [Pantoea agglomerans]NEH04100.1 hypothetical protein [Pantoea agglomerans]NEH14497.1 hypothetical protein [Pantoea agglomerans]